MPNSNFKQIIKAEFSNYSASDFKADLLAGLTVAAVALPLALAFGVASGASAAAGLITAILSGLVIGFLSGAPYQISGPTGAMSAVLIILAQKYGIEGVWIAGFFSGFFLLVLGLFRLGRFISFIPAPVIVGFTSGIAIIIAVGQLDNLLGIKIPAADSALLKVVNFISGPLPGLNFSQMIGAIVIVGMLVWPTSWGKIMPSSLFFLIVATIVNSIFELNTNTIGAIPKQLILDQRLELAKIPWTNIADLLLPITAITALGAIESLLCGAVGSSMTGVRMYANQELIAQGVGNMIIPFCGGVPATAAIARSSVGIKAGGKTRMVSIVHALALLASMFALSPLMSKIPLAALAGILIVTAWRMNEWHSISFYFKKRLKSALFPFFVTMIATFSLDLTQAILIGTILSALIFLTQAAKIHINVSRIDSNNLSKSDIPYAAIFDDTSIVYLSGLLFFAASGKFYEKVSLLKKSKAVILSMRGVPLIDTSGYEALERLRNDLKLEGGVLMLAGLNDPVTAYLKRLGFLEHIGEENIFWSADQALRQLGKR